MIRRTLRTDGAPIIHGRKKKPFLRQVSRYEPSRGVIICPEPLSASPAAPQHVVMGVDSPRRMLLLKEQLTSDAVGKKTEQDKTVAGIAKPLSISPNKPRQAAVGMRTGGTGPAARLRPIRGDRRRGRTTATPLVMKLSMSGNCTSARWNCNDVCSLRE